MNYFSFFEKILMTLSSVILITLSYFMYDDSLLYSFNNSASGQAIGTLQKLEKDVRIKSQTSFSWIPAMKNNVVSEMDSVFTGENSEVNIHLKDGTILELGPDSMITLNLNNEQLKLNLKYGDLSVSPSKSTKVTLMNAKKELQIETPVGESAGPIEFKVQKRYHILETSPKKGKLQVRSGHESLLLSQGESANINSSGKIKSLANSESAITKSLNLRSKILLSSPPIIAPPEVLSTLPVTPPPPPPPPPVPVPQIVSAPPPVAKIMSEPASPPEAPLIVSKDFTFNSEPLLNRDIASLPTPEILWKKSKGASEYLVEISNSLKFEKPILVKTKQNSLSWASYKKGVHYYRVSALHHSLQSPPSESYKITVTVPNPKLSEIKDIQLSADDPLAKAPTPAVQIQWSDLPLAKKYALELSKQNDFKEKETIVDIKTLHSYILQEPGEYFARVKAFSNDSEPLTEFSNTIHFKYTFLKPIATPLLSEPLDKASLFIQSLDDAYIWLEWKPVEKAKDYIIEVSTQKDFQKLITQQTLSKTRFLVKNGLPLGRVYWRVKAVATEPLKDSSWSSPYVLDLHFKKNEVFEE